ncbi:MAG: hypothetical protein JXB88_07775 [Spirochaetales bacterium]|nr:hypothetical protein [Spirochaetales bacterium]
MKKIMRVFLLSALLLSMAFFIGCSLTEDSSKEATADDSIREDILKAIKEKEAQGDGGESRWNGSTHKSLVQYGCEMIGVENSDLWEYSDDPDSFSSVHDEGYNGYPGKPGHCYFYTYDDGKWKHRTPWTSIYGDQDWADYNIHRQMENLVYNYNRGSDAYLMCTGYIMHYITDMGVPYHVYWGNTLSSTWYQHKNHSAYENAVEDNWTSGKKFLHLLGGGTFMADMYNASTDKDLIKIMSRIIAEQTGRTVVETIGSGSINFDNSNVYNKTVASLSMSASGVITTLAWLANYFGVLQYKSGTYGSLNEQGEELSLSAILIANSKLYCGASWRKKYGGDIDVKVYRFDFEDVEYKAVAISASSSDNPETLQYVAPVTGIYKIVAYAYTPTTTQVSLNALAVVKDENRYIFD